MIHTFKVTLMAAVLFVVFVALLQTGWQVWRIGMGGWSDVTGTTLLVFAGWLAAREVVRR